MQQKQEMSYDHPQLTLHVASLAGCNQLPRGQLVTESQQRKKRREREKESYISEV